MQQKLEVSAKKVDDAIADGLKQLGLTQDDVDIKVLSTGGLFKKAKIEIYYEAKEQPQEPTPPAQKEAPREKPTTVQKEAPQKDKQPEKVAPAQKERPQEKKQPTQKETTAEEPHWASAPIKREPTLKTEHAAADKPQDRPATPQKDRGDKPACDGKPKQQKKRERESVPPTPEQAARVETFLQGILQRMKIEGGLTTVTDDGLRLTIETEDSRVIGYRGEVLDALQYLGSLTINEESGKFVHVSLDALNYREKRKNTLEGMARRMADKAVRTGRKVALEPMNSNDRRTIHAALGEDTRVMTRSEGHDPSRRVVILPKRH